MDKLEVQSTSKHSAVCSDIVVRGSELVRLIFRPEIVENPHDAAATIRGTFIYQRKGKRDAWADAPTISLNTVKKNEEYRLELKSGELLPLLRELGRLYRLSRREGVPQGKTSYVRLEQNLAEFLALSQSDMDEFLGAHQSDAITTLHKVLRWLANSTALSDFMGTRGDEISVLNAMLGVAGLRTVLSIWADNESNDDEEFWQATLSRHAFVLSQVFAYPIVVIGERAYVGGKTLDNRHGGLADFLAAAKATGSVLIIEIKTPVTQLLGREYRTDVFPPSEDFSGAISQVLKYQDTLAAELHSLAAGSGTQLLATQARCLVIAGHASHELNSPAKRRSFERVRERISGVVVITYDELFGRVAELEKLLTEPGQA